MLSSHQYLTGIGLLSVALLLSGLLGVVQDRVYTKFRGTGNTPWEESMFYLHFLSMPMFLSLKGDIAGQFYILQRFPPYLIIPFSHPDCVRYPRFERFYPANLRGRC